MRTLFIVTICFFIFLLAGTASAIPLAAPSTISEVNSSGAGGSWYGANAIVWEDQYVADGDASTQGSYLEGFFPQDAMFTASDDDSINGNTGPDSGDTFNGITRNASNLTPGKTGMLMVQTPEPATMLLLGTGLIGVATIGRKKLFKK